MTKGVKKTPKVPGFMRQVIGRNVDALLKHHYKQSTQTARVKALAKDAKVGHGTVQRIIDYSVGASIDNLEAIAQCLQVMTYQLMIPALDIQNPQVIKGASETEKALYMRWRRTGLITG